MRFFTLLGENFILTICRMDPSTYLSGWTLTACPQVGY